MKGFKNFFIVGVQKNFSIRRFADGKIIKKLDAVPFCVDVSPDGKNVAFGDIHGNVGIFSTSGKKLWSQKLHSHRVELVAFSPDGKTLASICRDHSLKLWNVKSGEQIWSANVYGGGPTALAFAEAIFVGDREGNIYSFDPTTGEKMAKKSGSKPEIEHLIIVGEELYSASGNYIYRYTKELKFLGSECFSAPKQLIIYDGQLGHATSNQLVIAGETVGPYVNGSIITESHVYGGKWWFSRFDGSFGFMDLKTHEIQNFKE